jgi:short subunit dehydrogenase-like uncharacterized protein
VIGRDADRLRAAATQAGVKDAEVRVAGLDDAALVDALRDVDVVISAVAPFVRFGEPVVQAAIAAHTHYVDISGEQQFVKNLFDTYGEPAQQAGVAVVPMINDGGLLGDLASSLAAQRVARVESVTLAHRITGGTGISRGSGRTALANAEWWADGGLIYTSGDWRTGTSAQTREVTFPGQSRPTEVVKFASAEVVTVPRHIRANHVEGVAEAALAAVFGGFTPELVETLPEFPRDDPNDPGQYLVLADVVGPDGASRGVVEGTDTYLTTSLAAAEAAVRLATVTPERGVLAPSQAFDPASFLDSLAPHGVRWSVAELPQAA